MNWGSNAITRDVGFSESAFKQYKPMFAPMSQNVTFGFMK